MTTPRQLQDLISDIAHLYPAARFEFSPLPSGVCFLWLSLNGRDFVIEYDPKRSTGVSENFPNTPPFVGHDEVFPSLDQAIARFKAFLADAAGNETAPAGAALVLHDKPISN